MKQRSFLVVCAAAALVTGCSHFKKSQKPKENPAIAADTDDNFRQRFVEKRAAELVVQGVSADAARAQATEEFKARYGYTSSAKK
jgi:hypothetical protein